VVAPEPQFHMADDIQLNFASSAPRSLPAVPTSTVRDKRPAAFGSAPPRKKPRNEDGVRASRSLLALAHAAAHAQGPKAPGRARRRSPNRCPSFVVRASDAGSACVLC
jgi:hypothetical protein